MYALRALHREDPLPWEVRVPGGSHKSSVKDLELLIDTQATSGGVAGMEAPLWSFGHTTGCSIRRSYFQANHLAKPYGIGEV